MASSWQNIQTVVQKCVGVGLPGINMRTINTPGLLLLSKRPLINAKYSDFHPYTKELIERGYIEAETEDLGKFVCTHTTHNIPYYPEMELSRIGAFSTFTEQGRSERIELIQKFGHKNRLVLAGDFNVGDAFGPVINKDLPQEFNLLAKYFNVMPVKECTFCWPHVNIYTKSVEGKVQTIIDHVFYKGHKVVDMSRVIKPTDADLYGTFPLSDHNGVMATFSLC
jgi:endonuclease/exonuclease/phosphatase (EEP) superfamily protein YafD